MSSPASHQPQTPGSPGAVLAGVRAAKAREVAASAEILIGAYEWATMHEHPADEGGLEVSVYGNPVPVAGEGCPGVGEFAVAELAAALGVTTDAGKVLIGHAVELAHRLPKLWAQVVDGEVEAWRARRVAEQTIVLSAEAAGFVDKHTAAVAGKVGPVQLDRIVLAARRLHMAETLESEHDPDTARDRRGFWVHGEQVSYDGVVPVSGNLELPDALDLDQALGAVAAQLRLAGSVESLDARRALALGELARTQLALTLEPADTDDPGAMVEPRQQASVSRSVTLYVHLSEASVTGAGATGVGRCENTRTPIDPAAVREWCGTAGATVTVKPVIDLADQVAVSHYEVPARIKEAVALRDSQCVFPWCTRLARRCDADHVIPHGEGVSTCSCNIAPLCRHHHRLKTLTAWRYKMPEPGVYVWTSPHGYRFLRDHAGTVDVTPPGHAPPPGCPHLDGPSPGADPPDQ